MHGYTSHQVPRHPPPGYLIPSEKPVLFPAQEVCLIKNDNVLQENIPNELVFGEKRDIIEHYFT